MLFFVFSSNILQCFIGWEGVGLVSFLLVNFWFNRLEANRAALKAILFNRIGDIFYLFGVIFFFVNYKYCDIDFFLGFSTYVYFYDLDDVKSSMEIFIFFIFIAAMAKSSQIGLHAWLPDAMEGPTPVSSLLHSATMVTAGVYLLLRLSNILFISCYATFYFVIIGVLTALLGATVALCQEDLKKIIAYSTCSQLGILIVAIGMGNYIGCFFHLITHAFFKSLLFLTAGAIIHCLYDEQDIRKMGGLILQLPYIGLVLLIGIGGLVGFPFLSGYYSKEFIILTALSYHSELFNFVFICLISASFCTCLYGLKLFFLLLLVIFVGPNVFIKICIYQVL